MSAHLPQPPVSPGPVAVKMGPESTQRVRRKIRLGKIHADDLTFAAALDAIVDGVREGGGYVVTPNVDHVCLAETSDDLQNAYKHALLSLVDGTPLLWLARSLGNPLPEKISGSDLIRPLMARAAQEGLRVYFLGGVAGVADTASSLLVQEHKGLEVAGSDAPPLGFEKNTSQNAEVLQKIRDAKADIVLVALGCPKQELWMYHNKDALGGAVAIGIGASLDFIAGTVRRAPAWMSKVGLEWCYRLAQEPRRMAQRYLVRDRAILAIVVRMWLMPSQKRVFFG